MQRPYYGDLIASTQSILSDWTQNGHDAILAPYWSQLDPSTITSNNLNKAAILSQSQMYQPSMTMDDVNQLLSYIDLAPVSQKQAIIGECAQYGVSVYISGSIDPLTNIMTALYNYQTPPSSSSMALRQNAAGERAMLPLPPDSGYNCSTDGALIFAAGLAFATLSIMTAGSVDVLAGAAWGAIAFWGGTATTAWGAGHAIAGCGF